MLMALRGDRETQRGYYVYREYVRNKIQCVIRIYNAISGKRAPASAGLVQSVTRRSPNAENYKYNEITKCTCRVVQNPDGEQIVGKRLCLFLLLWTRKYFSLMNFFFFFFVRYHIIIGSWYNCFQVKIKFARGPNRASRTDTDADYRSSFIDYDHD